ncbi:hypothetical protein BJX63DRAFT_431480 [Aspergillus granulosus]|uniref:Uncharacterized protein n=1 Tax=Aspergillus granulosus TaxID=176169 RepID=A0ABR4HFR4_9EURO
MDQDSQVPDTTSYFNLSSSPEESEPPLPLLARPGLSSPKPALILLARTPHHLPKNYPSIISKLQRDVHIITIPTFSDSYNPIDTLTTLFTNPAITPSIAGIVIADASIMDVEDPSMVELTETLRNLIQTLPPHVRHPHRNQSHRTLTPTLLFAFDFPSQATHQPLLFHKYFSTQFGLAWRICGATMGRVSLEIQGSGLLKKRGRMDRGQEFSLRAVFLEDVQEGDKVLVVAKSASVKNGGLGRSGQPGAERFDWTQREEGAGESIGVFVHEIKGASETDSTAENEGEVEVSVGSVEVREGNEWIVAKPHVDRHGQESGLTGPGHEAIRMVEPCWDEYGFADDELTDFDSDGEFEFEDGKDKSSSSSGDTDSNRENGGDHMGIPSKRANYFNSPSHYRTNTISSSSSSFNEPDHPYLHPLLQSTSHTNLQSPKRKPKPARLANCPVAIHKLESTANDREGKRVRVRGHVGFVGHLEDNRSMASLILGMCAVRNTKPLPEGARRDLGVYFG